MTENERIDVYLICNAWFHDTGFARLELLKLLAENEEISVRVGEDYSDIEAINRARLLITYTCNVCPTSEQQEALKQFVSSGKRWFALHATNALIEFEGEPREVHGIRVPGKAYVPNKAPIMMEVLGSRFLSHPPVQKFQITASDPNHPLVKGIQDFEVSDEPYYSEYLGEIHTLLESRYTTKPAGDVPADVLADKPRPQLYLHPYGAGEVLYLALGHCCGKYDMQPSLDVAPVQRCSWEVPAYYELLRRGINWGVGQLGI